MNSLRSHPATGLTIIGLGVMLVALGVGAWSRAATTDTAEPPPVVLPVRSSEVRRVVVESDGHKVELVRRHGRWANASEGTPQTAVLISDAESRLFPLRAYRALDADTARPGYGLTRPKAVFTVEDTAGRLHRLLLGDPSFTTAGVYAQRGDDTGRVFLVPRATLDDLRSLVAGRRVHVSNDIPRKMRELEAQKAAKDEDTSWWLRQVLDAKTAAGERQDEDS